MTPTDRLEDVVRRTLACLPPRMAAEGLRAAARPHVEALAHVDDATWSAVADLLTAVLTATMPGAAREAYERRGEATPFDPV